MRAVTAVTIAAALLIGCSDDVHLVPPATATPPSGIATAVPLASITPPIATLATRPGPTACSSPTPTLDPQFVRFNGNLDVGQPFGLGTILFYILICRDIETIRQTYGLGPAKLVTTASTVDPLQRYYRAVIPVGSEAATVALMLAHPEDFQYVILDYIPIGGAPEATFVRQSSATPLSGQAGTSFSFKICCWDTGTLVTKVFTTPSGRTITVPDVVRADRTVPAGWGGAADDERGLYTIFVHDDGMRIGSLVHFRVF